MKPTRRMTSKNGSMVSGSKMWGLALGVGMVFAGSAVAQTKKTTTAPAKAPAVPQKPVVKPPQPNQPPPKPGVTGGGTDKKPPVTGSHPPPSVHTDPKELPEGKKVPTPSGGSVVKTGSTVTQYGANNRPVAIKKPGLTATFGQSGHPTMVRAERPGGGLQVVHRGPGGIRRAEGFQPVPGGGQVHTVSTGPRNGFVDRPVFGRPGFVRQSRMDGDRRYAVMYRGYHYRGVVFYRPVPVVVYSPAYYGWAVQSWGPAVVINVGYQSQPWYATYGQSFAPYQQYASPDQYLTDQILAQNMQQAYDAGRVAGTQSATADVPLAPPVISPQLKDQFDAQVKQEVQEQGQQAQNGAAGVVPPPATAGEADSVPDALKDGHTVFRVVATLDVESDGDECHLNADDWIIRNGGMSQDGTVPVTVAASRAKDCAQGSTARVSLNDLMTMQNEQDEQIGNALTAMAQNLGKGGLPKGPAGGAGAVPVPGGQPQPDLDLAANLQKEQVEANETEAQAVAPPAPAGQ